MACTRCNVRPVQVDARTGQAAAPSCGQRPPDYQLASEADPPFTLGLPGEHRRPPAGFGPPRICALCGVVYYPVLPP